MNTCPKSRLEGMAKNSEKHLHNWSVIIVGTRWGTLSFQVARVVVLAGVAVVLACVGLAAYGLLHLADRHSNPTCQEMIKDVKSARDALQTEKTEKNQLKEKLFRLENQFISIEGRPIQSKTQQKTTSEMALDAAKASGISVEQFKIHHHPEDSAYHFKLTLINSGQTKGRATGYVFIVLVSNRPGKEPDRSYPYAQLNNGKPVHYKEGEHFAIVRQKTIKGIIKKVSDPTLYQSSDLFIFSEEGALLWSRNFSLQGL